MNYHNSLTPVNDGTEVM